MKPDMKQFRWGTVELNEEKEKEVSFGTDPFEDVPENVQLTLNGTGDGVPQVDDIKKDGFKVKVPKNYKGKIMWLAIGSMKEKSEK